MLLYCLEIENAFYALKRNYFRMGKAYQMAIRNYIKHPFSESKGKAGRKWLSVLQEASTVSTEKAITLTVSVV
jgi:hypothetical protein